MRVILILTACASIIAGGAYRYTHPPLPASIHIWAETNNSFFDHGRSLRRSIARALRGSDGDVIAFIGDSRYTDGAGFYGLGDVLVGVAQELSDDRFAHILLQLAPDQHERVWMLFGSGAEYRSEPLSDKQLYDKFPKTMHILDEWQPRPNQTMQPTALLKCCCNGCPNVTNEFSICPAAKGIV